jgi:hypothetical protein
MGILNSVVFVSLQTGMSRIVLQQFECLIDLFKQDLLVSKLCFFKFCSVLDRYFSLSGTCDEGGVCFSLTSEEFTEHLFEEP